ncbi:RNA-directed DNA polymerase, eukaryota, reverse transcriptase zinc-binding domain protein, partial [Tanacetum coccineum]
MTLNIQETRKEEKGMKYIIKQSPWIVNGKPLIMQKWDPKIVIEKESPCKIPIWIRLLNVPLESWSIKGISSISSRLGCSHRNVFRHSINHCKAKPVINIEVEKKGVKNVRNMGGNKDGFMEVRNRKNRFWNNEGMNNAQQGNKQAYQRNNDQNQAMERKEKELSDDDDVYENVNQAVNNIIADEVLVNKKTLMGDFNVILKPVEQSNGPSGFNSEMSEFRDVVNSLEIDDLCSYVFNFTWKKSLKNPMTSTLKKLDRIMTNEEFTNVHRKALDVFLPYLIYDHSPLILIISEGLQKKKSTFRFTNHVADKKEFLDVVKGVWQKEIKGFQELKQNLVVVQSKLDVDPSNKSLKGKVVQLGKDYTDAAEDELKLLHQKAKVNWLKEGDKNSAYFHSILKTRKNKSRVEIICKEDGSRVDGEKVPEQFVNHFKSFLGQSQHVLPLSNMD